MNQYVLKRRLNIVRVVAYIFIGLFYIALALATLVILPDLLGEKNLLINSNSFLILRHIIAGIIFGIVNIAIMYYMSLSNPLFTIPNYAKIKIKISIYIINILLFNIFMIFITLSTSTYIGTLDAMKCIFMLKYSIIVGVVSSFIVNIFLFTLSLPIRRRNEI